MNIRIKLVKTGGLVKTQIAGLHPRVSHSADLGWVLPVLWGSVVFSDPTTRPHHITSGLLYSFALPALPLSLKALNISGENPFSAWLKEMIVSPTFFYSSKTDKQNCTYIWNVRLIEFSQTEHTHLTSTQSKKQVTSPQKSPSCPFHNFSPKGNHYSSSNNTDLFYLFL